MQDEAITKDKLYAKGWTISAAARQVNRKIGYVNQVINGKKNSTRLMSELRALPKRTLVLREKITR